MSDEATVAKVGGGCFVRGRPFKVSKMVKIMINCLFGLKKTNTRAVSDEIFMYCFHIILY